MEIPDVDVVDGGTESAETYDDENSSKPPRAATADRRRDCNSAKFDTWIDLGRYIAPSSPTINNHDEAIERNSCMLEDLLVTALAYDAHIMNMAASESSTDTSDDYVRPRHLDRPSSSHSQQQDGSGNSTPAIHIGGTNDVLLSPTLRMQIRKYVTHIASKYHRVGFHSFEHASHVMLSATKIVYMLQRRSPFHRMMNGEKEDFSGDIDRDSTNQDGENFRAAAAAVNNKDELRMQDLDGTIYDPWIHFAIALSALLHDVDHKGLPNVQLSAESDPLAKKYGSDKCMKSYAEWNSLDIGLTLLNDGQDYGEFDRVLGVKKERVYRMITDLVLCTDIASKERRDLGTKKWENSFSTDGDVAAKYRRRATIETGNTTSHLLKNGVDGNRCSSKLLTPEAAKAISEQIMQAADVSHTMQHFSTFTKWNKRLYYEVLAAHNCGRTLAHHEQRRGQSALEIQHPKKNWYDSQIGFYTFYIIPLAERLDACGAFSDDDKFAPLAVQNKENWIEFGRELTTSMVMEAECMELPPPMPIVFIDDLRKKTDAHSSTDITKDTDDVSLSESIEASSQISSLGGMSRGSRSKSTISSSSMLKWGKQNSAEVDSSVNAIVPDIFVKQLIDSFQSDVQCVPPSMRVKALQSAISKYQSVGSIQRHYGALLLVDISGFTHLSQKYPIEDFKMFINAYFTKIIDLVHSFDGDVVKFAGDALFAIWTNKVSVDGDGSDSSIDPSETTRAESSHAINIEKCTACAIAINAECNNYKVSKSYSRSHSFSESYHGKEVLYTFQDKNAEYEERGSVLNVHCGVSEGTMAGVDVVANNRAEFFLVGKPLKDVADAEALAAAGELVVSPSVYYSLTKTEEISSIASKLVFKNVGSEPGLGWESEFHRASWSDHSTTADLILNYFKDKDGTPSRKRDNAQSLINDLVKSTHSISDEEVASLQDKLMRLLENHRHEAARDVVGRFTAELRRVVVLFISISIEPALPEKPSDDKFLLDNLQTIYSILMESVSSRSGQIRQFMYDDKGTVLIASFGLRGSVLLNAADIALGAAQEAQSKLLDIMDVQCSIGITLGNIFCGETGSPQRYEYSLLGPEVNLAARLMAKSKPGQINCDEEFKNQAGQKDTFAISGTHHLKGYLKPVPFFMPVQYKSDVEYDEQDDIASFLMQKVVGLGLVHDIVKKRGLICNMTKHRVIIIKGDEVTGKEAFISGLLKELSVISCSVILEGNRCFHDAPFYCFIPIITKAILSFAAPRERLLSLKSSHKRSSVLASFLANDAFKTNAFPSWAEMVPDHLIPYLSLVNDFIYRGFPILKSSKEATLLKDSEKVEKCAEVLCALIIRYLELRQSHGILSIPEMEALDIYSKKLLLQILSSDANLLLIGGVDNSFAPRDEADTTDSILASILGEELDLKVELITLDLLDVKSTFDLFSWSLRRDFTNEELVIIHESEVLDKIFGICGGMPHATMGLAHTFSSQFKQQFRDLLEFTHTFLDDTPTDVQEIICYRLDQMKPEEQMLLKVCSIAGFGQYSFSQNLLETVVLGISRGEGEENFTLEESDDFHSESGMNNFNESGTGLISVFTCDMPFSEVASEESGYLNFMLQGDNFKELLESLVAHNYLKEINVEMGDLGSMDSVVYRFRNDQEQSVINGLMLNDQKKRMHFEVALYYSSTVQRGGGDSFGDNESSSLSTDISHILPADWELLNVIATHFDLADAHIPAMLHYYESSVALSSLGIRDRVHNRLLSAYMMLQKVLQAASTQHVRIDESENQRREVASQMIRTIRGDHLKDNVAVLAKLTKEHLSLAFKGDINAFKLSLTVLIKFAQSVGTIEKEGYIFGSELYSQAILMLLLVLDDDVFANLTTYLSSFLGQVDIRFTKIKNRDDDAPNDDSSLEDSCFDEDFYIDDLTVSFPAFSGLLTFFYYSPLGANQMQETFLANLFAAVAQEAKQTLHILRTKCILSHLYLKHGDVEKGLEESEEIKDIYNHDKYSLELVNTYGMDWAILNVATMASTYLFKGQFAAAYKNIDFLKAQMTKLDEFASSTKATTKGNVSSLYLLLREFQNAADSSNGLIATKYNYFYKPFGILQEELSNRELALSEQTPFDSSTCDFDLLSVLSSDSSSDDAKQGLDVQTAYANFPPPRIRSMMHQGAETLSDRGVEATRAALCATEIRNCELQPNKNADTTRRQLEYCQAGLIHLNQSLGQHDAKKHERRKNYLLCLYQQAELLFWHQALISKLMSFAESADDILGISGTEIDTAKRSLAKCNEMSENIYPFMQLLVGKRYIELGLDTDGGEHLIHHALTCLDDVDSAIAKSILSRLDVVENSDVTILEIRNLIPA